MSEFEVRPNHTERACSFEWCETAHDDTAHPEDEAHRSVGVGFVARVRGVHDRGPGVWRDVEVGVLRRRNDTESWLVIEAEDGTGLAINVDGARELRRALADDPQIRRAFSS